MRAHLLVRGERPAVPTGYHLLSRMFGHVTYVTRAEYSNRAAMFQNFVPRVQEILPNSKVQIGSAHSARIEINIPRLD